MKPKEKDRTLFGLVIAVLFASIGILLSVASNAIYDIVIRLSSDILGWYNSRIIIASFSITCAIFSVIYFAFRIEDIGTEYENQKFLPKLKRYTKKAFSEK